MSPESVEMTQDSTLTVGSVVDERYSITGIAGRGGNGVVYKAQHVHISRIVALKMMLRDSQTNEEEFKRFRQEADAASQLRHPNIVTIYDFGPIGADRFYLAMDFLDGRTLQEELRQNGPLSLDRAKHIFTQACSALDHAHRKKVVHRDIKPGNFVILDRDGDKDFLVIVDFGLVKLMHPGEEDQRMTKTGTIVGSPLYMSPEQIRGQALDHRTDIYSLGCVMYEALTGKAPLAGPTSVDTMYKHLKEMPPTMKESAPGIYIPPALERTIMKALSKDPGNRHETMSEFAKEISRAMSGAPDTVPYVSYSKTEARPQGQSQTQPQMGRTTTGSSKEFTADEILTSTMIAVQSHRRKTAIPGWVWRIVSVCIVVCLIVGSVGLVVTTLTHAIAAKRSHKSARKSKDFVPITINPTEKPVEDESAQMAQLQHTADEAFESGNWTGANDYLVEYLHRSETAYGADNPVLAPTLAKLTVCSFKANETGTANRYATKCLSLSKEDHEEMVNDPRLLSAFSDAVFNVGSSDDVKATTQLCIGAVGTLEENSEESVSLNIQMARLYNRQGNTQMAEQLLRQSMERSSSMPELNKSAKTWLVSILNRTGRNSEAETLEGQ